MPSIHTRPKHAWASEKLPKVNPISVRGIAKENYRLAWKHGKVPMWGTEGEEKASGGKARKQKQNYTPKYL